MLLIATTGYVLMLVTMAGDTSTLADDFTGGLTITAGAAHVLIATAGIDLMLVTTPVWGGAIPTLMRHCQPVFASIDDHKPISAVGVYLTALDDDHRLIAIAGVILSLVNSPASSPHSCHSGHPRTTADDNVEFVTGAGIVFT
ncbi:hypothetical protein E2562_036604 [Oryza meyeriana var. granulata]|uniref:Uncharacterized protein n=1 Tax=Oryza meyeriana var. granulata TaxID=110450 RepID=A0A6G1DAP6_9ORYZ|nr:hypothetical protein E2562_036604 [Oryza meyeriana var. granulata]